jgi:hypothetical protein
MHHALTRVILVVALAQVYQLPEPCSAEYLAAVTQWQFMPEAEDEEQKRREFYGMGGGTTFGEVSGTCREQLLAAVLHAFAGFESC